MIESFASRARSWAVLLLCMCFCFGAASVSFGCGRSSLDDSLVFDGGTGDVVVKPPPPDGPLPPPDGGTCNPSTCPDGCCDASGRCRVGTDLQACGAFGITCNDCVANGFDFCDVGSHSCGRVVPGCNPSTCGDGCCEGDQCLAGTDPNECGRGGEICRPCAINGQACDPASRTCAGVKCGSDNCSGCCIGDLCVPGTDGTACGRSGQQCDNCASQGTSCGPTFPGGVCEGNPSCGSENCTGCCAGNVCLTGVDNTSCGLKGEQCTNCTQFGELCQPLGGLIGGTCTPQQCGPQNCKGCCSGNTCINGDFDNACGNFGQQCKRCGTNQACSGGICQGNTLCDASNCAGCCIGDICAVGSQNTACGVSGKLCSNCASNGQVCQGGACQTTCGPGNCAGCCNGNSCVMGGTTGQCGVGGQSCQACNNGDVCSFGKCLPPPPVCNATTCKFGCCDPVLGCLGGFTNSSCGSEGNACSNCNQTGSTCNQALTPRACRNAQTTCPGAYPGCPGNVSTPIPSIKNVCSANELQNARAACAGGPASIGCQAYFQFEQATNPSCASCLLPFDVPFDGGGLAICLAPFVSPTCNHATACLTNCTDVSCQQCPPGQFNQCRQDVRNNQCSSFVQDSLCAASAFLGAGAFCNPLNYQGNYGRWLQGVGGHYCSP